MFRIIALVLALHGAGPHTACTRPISMAHPVTVWAPTVNRRRLPWQADTPARTFYASRRDRAVVSFPAGGTTGRVCVTAHGHGILRLRLRAQLAR